MAPQKMQKVKHLLSVGLQSSVGDTREEVLVTAPHLSDVTQGKTAVTGVKAGEASHGDVAQTTLRLSQAHPR